MAADVLTGNIATEKLIRYLQSQNEPITLNFGKLQEAIEKRGLSPLSAEHEYISSMHTELPEDQAAEVLALIDKLEQDDDVQKVFHTLA